MQLGNILSNIVNQQIKTGYAFAVITAHASGATPKTCTIKLSGSTEEISGIRYMNYYTPTVNDTVLVLVLEKDLIIAGDLEP